MKGNSKLCNKARFRLSEYSKFSLTFLFIGSDVLFADAIYTDIDPDVVLSEDLESYVFDMNGDALLDFGFLNFSYWTYTSTDELNLLQRIWALPETGNSIAGSIFMSWFSLPYALQANSYIGNSLQFNTNYIQRMAFRSYYYKWNGMSSILTMGLIGGNWYPEVLDHYLGVRFIDMDSNTHYGWIRCDVKDEGRTIVIKDYAYESKPGMGIYAGDTIGDTTVNILQNQLTGITIYSFNSILHIQLPGLAEKYKMRLLSLNGACVYTCDLKEMNNVIPIEATASGVFLVEVVSANGIYTKKVNIN